MKTYRWIGPVQHLTLTHEGREIEVRLITGRQVELPEEHPTVQCWVATGHLQEIETPNRRGRKSKEVNTDA